MPTDPLFYRDPYATSADATVIHVDADWIVLDRTVFYPMGGGQPGDTGTVQGPDGTECRIVDTRKGEGGSIRHRLETASHGLARGEPVSVALDWERRYRHMRMHTCLHLLGSLVPAGVTGGSVGEERSRLDFDAGDLELDRQTLTEQLNALIRSAHPVRVEQVDEAVLDAQPELVRTMSVKPPRGVGSLRMIRVEDVDYQPCGGTHVSDTSEIGPVHVAKIESKGKHNRRVQVRLGPEGES